MKVSQDGRVSKPDLITDPAAIRYVPGTPDSIWEGV
jgi:hypothetical protein